MKSKAAVIAMGALLCCIPALVYLLFSNLAQQGNIDPYANPETAITWPVTTQNTQFSVALSPKETPLTRGKKQLILKIEPLMDGLTTSPLPGVTVSMPMGKNTMEANVQVHKLPGEMQYRIETDLPMAGHWVADIRPSATSDPLHLDFLVKP